MVLVYLGIGGNLEGSYEKIQKALSLIASRPVHSHFKKSDIYRTTPVSSINQPHFYNCAVSFETDEDLPSLFHWTEGVEKALGKVPKAKDCPRPIDIDLLFYGESLYKIGDLEVPHPRWRQRLFVLIPLNDLTDKIVISEEEILLEPLIKNFINANHEVVTRL